MMRTSPWLLGVARCAALSRAAGAGAAGGMASGGPGSGAVGLAREGTACWGGAGVAACALEAGLARGWLGCVVGKNRTAHVAASAMTTNATMPFIVSE
jgi:hypothetical protein